MKIEEFKSARLAGVPIIIIRAPDFTGVESSILEEYKPDPVLHWDIGRGVVGLNEAGGEAAALVNQGDPAAITTANPQEALTRALSLMPQKSILFFHNAHIMLESKDDGNRLVAIQNIVNCRDPFKNSERTLVLLVPDLKTPPELINDVITLDVALPGEQELAAIVSATMEAGQQPPLEEKALDEAVGAVSGLSGFVTENAVAMSMRREGLDLKALWDRKVSVINSVSGLQVYRTNASFDKLGGLQQIKDYGRMIINGKRKPRLVVLWDELEKSMSGLGDSNGINADMLAQVLGAMQDYGWDGMLLPGFPGTGKTEYANALGAEAGGLFVKFDVGGTKNSLVGDSEKMIRAAIQALLAMGGENVLWVGTSNSMETLPPELKRRFSYGNFFFDLPTWEEQVPIWDIYTEKFGIADKNWRDSEGWTGAEIKKVCKLADEFGVPLSQAAQYISPVAKLMGKKVDELRESAAGRYLSASTPGLYQTKRSIDTAGMRKFINEPPKIQDN